MEQKSPVYFKIEYENSIDSKKEVLSTEVSLLNLLKTIKRYHAIRIEELKIKTEISRSIKHLDSYIKRSKSSFPFFKVPKTKRKEYIPLETKMPLEKEDTDLETELKAIQEKLNSLNR